MENKNTIERKLFDEVMVPNYAPGEIIPVKGEGSLLWDQEGREFIDFAGGIAVNALGHCHPEMVKAVRDQSEKLWHVSNVLTNKPALSLAKKLCENTFAEKVFFSNSGGESNEAALKLARKYASDNFSHEKNEIISFYQSFHGRTLFTVSVGGQEKYTRGFGPLPGGITHLEYNNLKQVEETITEKTCAVIVEPIQGEGGIIKADPEFLKGLRNLCDKVGALLIFDEVQTGFGRTGSLYAYMETGVTPDILTSAKGLGCGFPIGAMLTTTRVAKSLGVGTHGCTYGGNPLACAVAEKAFDLISDPGLLKGVREKRQLLSEELMKTNERFPFFSEIRGEGLLLGLKLKEKWKGKASQFVAAAEKQGLMILVAGPDVVRMAPSLIIPDDLIIKGTALFCTAVESIVSEE